MRYAHSCVLVALLAAASPLAVRAQGAPRREEVDSLKRELAVLRARLDSLLRALPSPTGGPAARADTARPADDLAALRAAANAAAGRTDSAAAEAQPTRFIGRERNQSQLNPEISVTGDIRAYGTTTGVQRENFEAREVEIGFQSALDPYSHTKIFVALEGGEVDVEEGYAYWTGLPGHIRFDLGKFRQQFGEINRWHLHAVPETEFPLALTTYFGEEGLAGTGVSFYRAFGGFGTHELTAQVTRSASDDQLFLGGARPSYLLRLLNFWQLNRSTYVQLGASGLYGNNPDSSLRTTVGGVDVRLTWRPPARALYREWTLRAELYGLRQRIAGAGQTRLGGYVSTTYKMGQRWIPGVRYDYVDEPDGSGITRQVVPSLTWWQSEWVFLRAQYRYLKSPLLGTSHQFALQAVWAMGPHKHETY